MVKKPASKKKPTKKKVQPPEAAPVELTRGELVIEFIEEYCYVPEGKRVGQRMVLDQFQKDFIIAVYDNPAGTQLGILSIARKNGKTALIAAIVLCHLVGPEAVQNSQIVSGARSRKQAALVFNLAVKMIRFNPELDDIIHIVPSSKTLIGLTMGTTYEALAAEAGTSHGLSPVLAIIDEMGQVVGEQDDFIEAIETAQGAYDDALELIISTQAPTDADMLSIRIDDARRSQDPTIVCHVYSADDLAKERAEEEGLEQPEAVDVLDEEAWQRANPALGSFRSLIELQKKAAIASRMPSAENGFRNLYLNQRVNRNSPFLSPEVWAAGNTPIDPEAFQRGIVYGALDLAETTDLCAWLMLVEYEGFFHLKPRFWKAEGTLKDHEDRDRVPYTRWADEGLLETTPGVAVDYEFIAAQIAEDCNGLDVRALAYDRYRFKTLESKFEKLEPPVKLPWVAWGQGYYMMSPAIEQTEVEFLKRRVRHGGHPILTWNAANAVIVKDPAGNRKLDKSKSTGRIDGMVATVMAFGVRAHEEEQEAPSVYEERGVVML